MDQLDAKRIPPTEALVGAGRARQGREREPMTNAA